MTKRKLQITLDRNWMIGYCVDLKFLPHERICAAAWVDNAMPKGLNPIIKGEESIFRL